MKKLFLLSIGTALSFGVFAQGLTPGHAVPGHSHAQLESKSVNRTTSTYVYHDSLIMSNLTVTPDTPYSYVANTGAGSDSGYFNGTGIYGFSVFAERYDFHSADSAEEVIGVFSLWAGTVSSPSSHNVVFKVWNVGTPDVVRPTFTYNGFPGAGIDSVTASYNSLNISDTALTFNVQYFATPTTYLTNSFFVGCELNYNWAAMGGDTVCVEATDYRASSTFTVASGDTTVNDVAAIYFPGGSSWIDVGYDLQTPSDFYLFPIVISRLPSASISGVTRKDLTFFGNYPNPAVNSTNIKFSLAAATDVTIYITDMSGRTINTISQAGLAAGEHTVPVSTENMPAGNYIYLVRTGTGSGIASKLTVAK